MSAWLDVIGIGEDGWAGLSDAARARLGAAEVIIGGTRHHGLAPHLSARRIRWPSPFGAMLDEISDLRGQNVVVLVTGDPTWFSAGAHLGRKFGADEVTFHPQLSAFQWAAARLGWSLADVETLTIHGRPAEQVIPYFAPHARLLVLTQDGGSPATVAQLLTERGFGPSQLIVLGALGGPDESRDERTAIDWGNRAAPEFHILAIECAMAEDAPPPLPLAGLPDEAFEHDGQLTKREVRAMTLAALGPRRGAVLWDLGAGAGSVGIEWMRAASDAQAVAVEPRAARRAMIATNAARLGTPRLRIVEGRAPEAMNGLPQPDAVFIGGGFSRAVVAASLDALAPHGRLVANAVTLESEALMTALQGEYGGTLSRIAVSRAEPIGSRRGWKPFMPVTQWVLAR